MGKIDSSQTIAEAFGNESRAPPGLIDTKLEPASRADQNHQGGSKVPEDAHDDDARASAETGRPGDERHAGRDDAESNLGSNILDSTRTPAYTSYLEYIQDLQMKSPGPTSQYDDLRNCLHYDGKDLGAFQILIADSGKHGITSTVLAPDLSVLSSGGNVAEVDRTLIDDVLRRIKTPPKEDVEVRIIILELAVRQQSSSRAILDAIGLTYDVDPAFLNAFFCYNRNRLNDNQPHSPRSLFPKGRNFIRFHGCFIGQVIERFHPFDRSLKIVLILSWINKWDPEVQGIVFGGSSSVYSTVQKPLFQRSRLPVGDEERNFGWYCQVYGRWLSQLDQDQLDFNVLHPHEFIYPWIEYRVYDIVTETRRLRRKLNGIMKHFLEFGALGFHGTKFDDDHLFFWANVLKDFLAAGLELRRTLPKFGNSTNTEPCGRIKELQDSIKDIVDDSDDVLKSIFQYQQTAIGTMAIQESRRSIKEAVSVKRLTQLAFVFIPLSYASSLFGMNINEMTGNGSNLWTFLVTSLALLLGATSFWWLSSNAREVWATHMEGRHSQDLAFKDRIKIIYAGIRTGNCVWMIKEGILLGLLTNNLFGNKEDTFGKVLQRFFLRWTLRQGNGRQDSSV